MELLDKFGVLAPTILMPVYHIIVHTYGSWLPDQPDGYYDRKDPHRHPPSPNLARSYKAAAKGDVIRLSVNQQQLLLRESIAAFACQGIKVHAAAVVDTHAHLMVSWSSDKSLDAIKRLMKQILTHILNRHANQTSGRWFSRGTGDKKIQDRDHLVELVKRYFPGHGENVWIEPRIQQWL